MTELVAAKDLLERFVELGGKADNVQVKCDSKGLGLEAIQPDQEVSVVCPQALHIPLEAIDIEKGKIRDSFGFNENELQFLQDYLDLVLSAERIGQFRELASAIQQEKFEERPRFQGVGLGRFIGLKSSNFAARSNLLSERIIGRREGQFLVPVIDLANHSPFAKPYERLDDDSSAIQGQPINGEVCVSYGINDALGMLNSYRFVVPTPVAFSGPMSFGLTNGQTLRLGRQLQRRVQVQGKVLPVTNNQGEVLSVAFLPVANRVQPAHPRDMFHAVAKMHDVPRFEEVWAKIRQYNTSRVFEAYEAASEIKNDELRNLMRHGFACQIETLVESL